MPRYLATSLWRRPDTTGSRSLSRLQSRKSASKHQQGLGVAKDYAEAARWFRKAAEQGNAIGQRSLGRAYEVGEGVPRDLAQAGRCFRKAADQGDATAQGRLGVMYLAGVGVPQDDVKAYMWLNLSAARGIKRAAEERDKLAQSMTPAQINEGKKLARAWKPKPER